MDRSKSNADTHLLHETSVDHVRLPRIDDQIIEGYSPHIPDAYPDGTIPNSSIANGLVVHAPVISTDGWHTITGNVFDLIIDGDVVPGTSVEYTRKEDKYVVLRLPQAVGASLSEGFHDFAYRDTPEFGLPVQSEATQVLIDRTPAGARRLPRIEFPLSVQREGMSLATLLSLPDQVLRGTIPGYAGFDVLDKLHICMKTQGGREITLMTATVSPDDDKVTLLEFDRAMLGLAEENGTMSFYYYVEDKAQNISAASIATPISLFLNGAPESLDAPVIHAASDDIVTEQDIKPVLKVGVPALTPAAQKDDVIILFGGSTALRAIRLTGATVSPGYAAEIELAYDDVWDIVAEGQATPFDATLSYVHMRDGVPSRSTPTHRTFELTVPGGRDPHPATEPNEGLPTPVLRGKSGTENHITFDDAKSTATVTLSSPVWRGARALGLEPDDVVTAVLADAPIGKPFRVVDADVPVSIEVLADELQAHAGTFDLWASVSRNLSKDPHTSISRSPAQAVRIDIEGRLPGGGSLQGAVFVDAAKLREVKNQYAVYEVHLKKGFTPVRIYGYANMAVGDEIEFHYTGFDSKDAGNEVPAASGVIKYSVTAADLVPKEDDLAKPPRKVAFIDLTIDSKIVFTLAYGRFESFHTVKNSIGQVKADAEKVIVSARVVSP